MPTPESRRLYRSVQGRVAGGVAAGLAEHLRVDVLVVRLAFVVLCLAGGVGAVAYALLWVVVPQRRPVASGRPATPVREAREARDRLLPLTSLVVGSLLLLRPLGLWLGDVIVWPAVVVGAGLVLLWRQADESQRRRWLHLPAAVPGERGWRSRLPVGARLAGGVALVVAGAAGFLAANDELQAAREGIVAIAVVLAGVVLLSGPWWWRLASDLAEERRERIRSQERAEVADHLHDSVLQTLALIQRHAGDPRQVLMLARGQERDLRRWLFSPQQRVAEPTLGDALAVVAAEVEDSYGVPVEVVTVGSRVLDERLDALLQAAREAMVNAAKFSGAAQVSVFAEAEARETRVFVRDRGCGFDPDAVPADRRGLAESVRGRMARHGGRAVVRAAPGEGTEVELLMAHPVEVRSASGEGGGGR